MHLHEFQAKTILRQYGVQVPDFVVISSANDVNTALKDLNISEAVVKAQIHAGGRGKAGGVVIAPTPEEVQKAAEKMLGMIIINNQTGKEGIKVRQVLISPLVKFTKEYYLAAAIDRKNGQAVIIASPDGGMEIEEIAAKTPERIKTIPISHKGTLRNYQLLELAKFMDWTGPIAEQGKKTIEALIKAFIDTDASLLEINPLVLTTEEDIVALDAKLTIDDNALFRQHSLAQSQDLTQVSIHEARAKEFDLAYVALDGNIGCIVNGAGLAMATMDIIYHYGGKPANFLDIGGGATEEKIAEGFKILLSDPKIKAILVNIFGGIMNCATLAAGLVTATTELKVKVPLIIRMEGTNVEKGKKILQESDLKIIIADDLTDAAKKAVAYSKEKTNVDTNQ